LERVIEHLALQREMAEGNRGTTVCVGFSAWKRRFVPSFLRAPGGEVTFARDSGAAERLVKAPDTRLLVWGSRDDAHLRAVAGRRSMPIWRMVDGFLRSVGLGAVLALPASLVVDRLGVYYDPSRPSDLERILEEGGFGDEELRRARRLRETIV